jgi:TonB family protein
MTSNFDSNGAVNSYTAAQQVPNSNLGQLQNSAMSNNHHYAHHADASSSNNASIDAATYDQVMSTYYADCKYRIKNGWKPATRIGTLRIDTHFRIHKNGDITDIKITRTSGSTADDSTAVQAIKRANPLARLPLGCPDYVDVDFVFEINFGTNSEPFEKVQGSLCPPRRKPTLPRQG